MTKHLIILDIVGLTQKSLNKGSFPSISSLIQKGESFPMEPVFPAVTCTAQASILSGCLPSEHGIIANGLYDRISHSVSFWEQASGLVQTPRIWDTLKFINPSIKTAVHFFQNSMFCNSDIVISPRPLHMDNEMIMWCYSKPTGYYEKIQSQLGEFELSSYWGPLSSSLSSEWITKSIEYTLEYEKPNLVLGYLPHLDYSCQRYGKNSTQVTNDLKKADEMVGRIIDKTKTLGIFDDTEFVFLSEYGFHDVTESISINLKLRDNDLLAVREIKGKEYLDFELSKAFAMVDHQVAHIYAQESYLGEIKRVLEDIDGIDKVISGREKKDYGIDNPRSGEFIAISEKTKWFNYYWWHDYSKAPPFARGVDIHRKPGYDPLELFFDPKTRSISFDTSLIKASHGTYSDEDDDLPVFASSFTTGLKSNNENKSIKCTDVGKTLIDYSIKKLT